MDKINFFFFSFAPSLLHSICSRSWCFVWQFSTIFSNSVRDSYGQNQLFLFQCFDDIFKFFFHRFLSLKICQWNDLRYVIFFNVDIHSCIVLVIQNDLNTNVSSVPIMITTKHLCYKLLHTSIPYFKNQDSPNSIVKKKHVKIIFHPFNLIALHLSML